MKKRTTHFHFFVYILAFIVFALTSSFASVPDIVLDQTKAVVTVYVSSTNKAKSITGSGFVVKSDGIVITNYHVIADAVETAGGSIIVRANTGAYFKVEEVVAYNEEKDIAILKLDARDLPITKLAAKYNPKAGDSVVVIGSPFGLEATVTDGIISSIRGKDKMLQISAAISPGSSGSPVFNLKGEVIGVATLTRKGGQNLNFAMPIAYVQELLRTPEKINIPINTKKPEKLSPANPANEKAPESKLNPFNGVWNASDSRGRFNGKLTLHQSGSNISGTLQTPGGTVPVSGSFSESMLTLRFIFDNAGVLNQYMGDMELSSAIVGITAKVVFAVGMNYDRLDGTLYPFNVVYNRSGGTLIVKQKYSDGADPANPPRSFSLYRERLR